MSYREFLSINAQRGLLTPSEKLQFDNMLKQDLQNSEKSYYAKMAQIEKEREEDRKTKESYSQSESEEETKRKNWLVLKLIEKLWLQTTEVKVQAQSVKIEVDGWHPYFGKVCAIPIKRFIFKTNLKTKSDQTAKQLLEEISTFKNVDSFDFYEGKIGAINLLKNFRNAIEKRPQYAKTAKLKVYQDGWFSVEFYDEDW